MGVAVDVGTCSVVDFSESVAALIAAAVVGWIWDEVVAFADTCTLPVTGRVVPALG